MDSLCSQVSVGVFCNGVAVPLGLSVETKFMSPKRLAWSARFGIPGIEKEIQRALNSRKPGKGRCSGSSNVRAVTVSPVRAPQNDSCDQPLRRLYNEYRRTKDLVNQLRHARSEFERDQVLNSDRCVQTVFPDPGGSRKFVKPAVELALKELSKEQLFLLKCLVACGQEHVLDLPVGWLDDMRFTQPEVYMSASSDSEDETLSFGTGSLKSAFSLLASMIEGWDKDSMSSDTQPKDVSRNLHEKSSASPSFLNGWDNPGVFPSPIMELVDWEGKSTSQLREGEGLYEEENESSVFGLLLSGWETPGVFPSQVMELFDLDGRYEKSGVSLSAPNGINELPRQTSLQQQLQKLVAMLERMEKFYDSIGGILGYQLTSLELIIAEAEASLGQSESIGMFEGRPAQFHVPMGANLAEDDEFAAQAAFWGLQGLPSMGEIFPLGGAGDRLGLVCEATGECLPVAMLPYCGRTLLEGLVRDLQAREYLYFRVFGERHITPIAIMTSAAKKNHERVKALCESKGWFGRGRENFFLFEQPLVPSVAAKDGRWLVGDPLAPVVKPGGHGVIWKLAMDQGVFEWFRGKGREAAIVRQISNPVAGSDVTLLALSGVGLKENKKFGFASCDRNIGTAEGVNVMVESQRADGSWEYGVTCVEYTEFEKLGITDTPVAPGSLQSQFPANTNVLFVRLAAVEEAVSSTSRAALPGLIMNLKKKISFVDHAGRSHSERAGRLECTMQNVADSMRDVRRERLQPGEDANLGTFLLYNDRRKVTSSAKRRRKPGEYKLHQTPDGSFLDLNRNSHDLFTSCGVTMPPMEGNQCYVDTYPPFIVLFHPALGPVWDVIRQKIQGGSIALESEVQLEVAELCWRNVHVDGSFIVEAKNVMEALEETSDVSRQHPHGRCGRCRLENVVIQNQGVDWQHPQNVFWQHKVQRREQLHVILHEDAEFCASNVTIQGNHTFEVPAGHRMVVTSSAKGTFEVGMERISCPSWEWKFKIEESGALKLSIV